MSENRGPRTPARRPAAPGRSLAALVVLAAAILALNVAYASVVPTGVYSGDFNGEFVLGLAFSWDPWSEPGRPPVSPESYEQGPGRTGSAQVIDLRSGREAAGVSAGLIAAGRLALWYRSEAGQAAGTAQTAGEAFILDSSGVIVSSVPLPRSKAWTLVELEVPSGGASVVVKAFPGWRLTVDDVLLREDRVSEVSAVRERLWGEVAHQPHSRLGGVDIQHASRAGRLMDALPPMLATGALSALLYLLVLRLSYRWATVILFVAASYVIYEPSPFEWFLVIWLVYGLLTRKLELSRLLDRRVRLAVVGAALYAVATVISWALGGVGALSAISTAQTIYCLILFGALVCLPATPGAIQDITLGLLLGALVGMAASLVAKFTGFLAHLVRQSSAEFRGFFKDSNVFASTLLFPVLVPWAAACSSRSWIRRLGWLALSFLLAVGVVMSGSRSGFGGLFVAVVAAALLAYPDLGPRVRRVLPVALLGLLAVGLAVGLARGVFTLRAYDLADRFPDLVAALRRIVASPLGLGPYMGLARYGVHPHNLVIMAFLEEGWLGGLGVICLFAGAFALVWRRRPRRPDAGDAGSAAPFPAPSLVLLAAAAGLAGVLATSMLSPAQHWRHLWILAGLLATSCLPAAADNRTDPGARPAVSDNEEEARTAGWPTAGTRLRDV
jgi:hypothetical protein